MCLRLGVRRPHAVSWLAWLVGVRTLSMIGMMLRRPRPASQHPARVAKGASQGWRQPLQFRESHREG